MRLDAGDGGNCLHAQRWHLLPSVGRLSRNLEMRGNGGKLVILTQTADRLINSSRHAGDPHSFWAGNLERTSFEPLAQNVKRYWKEINWKCQ